MSAKAPAFLLGTAGWSVPRDVRGEFPESGSLLERYAARFSVVEINSSFHRPHRATTYARWAAAVPESFRFSVKLPKTITHTQRLQDVNDLLTQFLSEIAGLGEKLGCLLVQLPPTLRYDMPLARDFFTLLRAQTPSPIAFEPRHASWFTDDVSALLSDCHVGRVAADPPPVPEAAEPEGAREFCYFRLHGAPRVYYSAYSEEFLAALVPRLQAPLGAETVWCIFDNTALGAATGQALEIQRRLRA